MPQYNIVILDPSTSRPQAYVDVEARKQSDGTVIDLQTTNIHGVATFTLTDDATFHARTANKPPLYQVTHAGRAGLMNVDYVVDSGGQGTHTALFGASGALAAALAAGGRKTIWICTTHTEPTVTAAYALGSQADTKIITIWGAPDNRSTILVDATSATSVFTYHKDTDCTLRFVNMRFALGGGVSYDMFSEIAGGTGVPKLPFYFDKCEFNGVRALENTEINAGLSNGAKRIEHCTGALANFVRSTAASGFGGTGELIEIEDCYLNWTGRINQLGNYEGSWGQKWSIRGGKHSVTDGPWFTWGNVAWARFHGLTVVFTATGGELFNMGPNVGDKYIGQAAVFQNLYVETNRADNRLIYFPSFLVLRPDEIVIDGLHGWTPASAGGTPVPMIEIATTNAPPVNLGLISCDGAWSDCYVGPASSGSGTSDHGLLTGLADDDHPQYQTPAEHTAIGDTSPHHAKYTDPEARTAVPYAIEINFGWTTQSPQIFAP